MSAVRGRAAADLQCSVGAAAAQYASRCRRPSIDPPESRSDGGAGGRWGSETGASEMAGRVVAAGGGSGGATVHTSGAGQTITGRRRRRGPLAKWSTLAESVHGIVGMGGN